MSRWQSSAHAVPQTPRWQNKEADQDSRMQIVTQIQRRLKAQKPDASKTWLRVLDTVCWRIERLLYSQAPSRIHYTDLSTLNMRIRAAALMLQKHVRIQSARMSRSLSNSAPAQQQQGVGRHTEHPREAMMRRSASMESRQSSTTSHPHPVTHSSQMTSSRFRYEQQELARQQQRTLLQRHARKCRKNPCPDTVHCAKMKELYQHVK